MHNKAFIADNSAAIVGGRNVADEYFEASLGINFSDMDVLALGPVAREVSASFDDYWNCVLSIPIEALVKSRPSGDDLEKARLEMARQREALKASSYGVMMRGSDFLKEVEAGKIPFVWATGEVLADEPLKVIYGGRDPERLQVIKMARQLRILLEGAGSELLLIPPYFVPRTRGLQWFKGLRHRGLRVQVITNSLASTDAPAAHFGYARYRKDLLRMGLELYELKPIRSPGLHKDRGLFGNLPGSSHGALHAKLLILDRRAVFVGSFNLDPRSARFDTQNGIVVHSPKLAEQAADLFAKAGSPTRSYRVTLVEGNDLMWITEENGREERYYREPQSGFWHRLLARLLFWVIPELIM